MDRFPLAELQSRLADSGRVYYEFLRRESMSLGLYELPAGGVDPQRPHTEDEMYVVLRGRARFRVGLDVRSVGPGDVLFVDAGAAHAFEDIAEALSVIVCFAPPEGTLAPDGS